MLLLGRLTVVELLRFELLLGRLTVVELLRFELLLGRLTVVELLRLVEEEVFTSLPFNGRAGKVEDVLLLAFELLPLTVVPEFLSTLLVVEEFIFLLAFTVLPFTLLSPLPLFEGRFTTGLSPSVIDTERGILLFTFLLLGLVLKEPGCLLPFSLPTLGLVTLGLFKFLWLSA